MLPYPPKGGVQQRSYYLLREAARRHDVDFAGLVQPAHQSNAAEVQEAREALSDFCSNVECFWIQSDRRPAGRSLLLARSLLSSRPYDVNWLSESQLFDYLRRRDIEHDLVHVDTVGLGQYMNAIGAVPFVLNHHNIESQMMSDRADKEDNLLKSLYLRREATKLEQCERHWAHRTAVNLLVSELDERRLTKRTGNVRTEVVRNGVDIDYFRPRSSTASHDGTLIFVGGMSWWPNRDAALWFIRDIWPQLRKSGDERKVTFIGRDPPDELLAAAEDPRVNAPGFVDDIRPAVDQALAYVCPIRKGGGTRLKVLDALAMGKPLIATSFAVEGLGLEPDVHFLSADRPSEYVKQVARLESKPDLRRRLAQKGRNLAVEKFAWQVIGEDLENAYQTATGK